jgi:hypothetical protein
VTEVTHFYVVQRMYVFFQSGIKRWDMLSSLISESDTHRELYIKISNPIRYFEMVEELLLSAIECTWDDDVRQMEIHYLIRSIQTSLHSSNLKPRCQYDRTYWYERRQKATCCSLLSSTSSMGRSGEPSDFERGLVWLPHQQEICQGHCTPSEIAQVDGW